MYNSKKNKKKATIYYNVISFINNSYFKLSFNIV